MSMELDKARIEKRNAVIRVWLKKILSGVTAAFAVLSGVIAALYIIGSSTPNTAVFDTPEGNRILFTDNGNKGYFDQVELQVLKPGVWYITLLTEPLDGKPQFLAGVIELKENREFSQMLMNDVETEEFINLSPTVSANEEGASILVENLNQVKSVKLNKVVDVVGGGWILRVIPKTNELVLEQHSPETVQETPKPYTPLIG